MGIDILWFQLLVSVVGGVLLYVALNVAHHVLVKTRTLSRPLPDAKAIALVVTIVFTLTVNPPFRLTSPATSAHTRQDVVSFDRHESTEIAGPRNDDFRASYEADTELHRQRMEHQRAQSRAQMKLIEESK